MQQAIIICFLAGLATYSSAQSITDPCLSKAQACFSNLVQLQILDYFNNNDYNTGCDKWSKALQCVNNVQSQSSCGTAQSQITNIINSIKDLNRGCNTDGTINFCQKEVAQCLGSILSASALLAQPSVNVFGKAQACALTMHYEDCLTTIQENKICQGNEVSKLQAAQQGVAKLKAESNCNTTCAIEVGKCFRVIGKQLVMPSQPSDMCLNYKKAFECTNGFDTVTYCKDNKDQFEGLLDSQEIQDYCSKDGSISACQVAIKNCDSYVPDSVFTTGTSSDRCKAFQNYLTCTQDNKLDACTENFVKTRVNDLRAKFLQQETFDKCPEIGDCKTRQGTCEATFVNALSPTTPDCQKALKGVQCTCLLATSCNAKVDDLLSKVDASRVEFCAQKNINLKTCPPPVIGQCSKQAQDCITNLKRLEILDYFDNDDYTNGCDKWAKTLQCVKNVKSQSSCGAEQVELAKILNSVKDLNRGCDENGAVNTCQKELAQCLGSILSASALLAQPTVNVFGRAQACALTMHFEDCLKAIQTNNVCPGNEVTKLQAAQQGVAKLKAESNCNTTCAIEVGKCFTVLGQELVLPTRPSDMCQNYKKAFECTNGFDTDTYCVDNKDQFEGLLDSQVIQDYCSKDGSISPCQVAIRNCDSSVPDSVFTTGSTSDRCNAFQKYLDCTEDNKLDACTENFVKNKVNELRLKFLKQETFDKCPVIGDCRIQKDTCTATVVNALSLSKPDCQKAQEGVQCNCRLASTCNAKLSDILGKVDSSTVQYCAKKNINLQTCGGSALQYSIGVIVLASITSLLKKWL